MVGRYMSVTGYLLYLPVAPNKHESAASIVAQMFGLDQEGDWRRPPAGESRRSSGSTCGCLYLS